MTLATKHETDVRQELGGRNYFPVPGVFSRSSLPHPLVPIAVPEKRTASPTRSRWLTAGLLLATVGLAILGALWTTRQPVMDLLAMVGDQAAVSAALKEFGPSGPLALALVQLIQVVVAFIPGHVFLVAAGYVYGFPAGLLLNLVCTVSASQLSFTLARRAGRPFVNRLVPAPALARWYKIGERRGFIFFLMAFVLPVFPTDIMNFVAGLSGIPSRKFFAANFLGRLPGAIMLTLIGSHGLQLPPEIWGLIALIFASLYLVGRWVLSRTEPRPRPR